MPERLRGFTTRRYINPLYLSFYLTFNATYDLRYRSLNYYLRISVSKILLICVDSTLSS